MNGHSTSVCGEKDDEQSLMKWKFKMPKAEKNNEKFLKIEKVHGLAKNPIGNNKDMFWKMLQHQTSNIK